MTDYFYHDFETRSLVKIREHGAPRYTRDCEPILLGGAINDGPVVCIDFLAGEKMPAEWRDAMESSDVIKIAQNIPFERGVWETPLLTITYTDEWLDLKSKALSLGLPESLEAIGEKCGLPADQQKLKDGKKLITRFCTPRRHSKTNKRDFWLPEEYPEEWSRFIDYCIQDVEVLRRLWNKLPNWNYPRGKELEIWRMDQEINRRGVPLDLALIEGGLRTVDREQMRLDKRVSELTGGEVTSARQSTALLRYLNLKLDCPIDNMQKATVREWLESA